MVKFGKTLLEGEGHVKTLWDSLRRMVLWKLLNTCGWIFSACLLLQLKSRSARGASHHPTFMGNCRNISHTFYSPIYPVYVGNEDVGSVWDNILFFFFVSCESSSLIQLKTRVLGEYPMCIVSVKITELRGRLKCHQGDTSWICYYL